MTQLKTLKLRKTILSQEPYLNASEISMAKAILLWLPYAQRHADTEKYFKKLRERDLKSHKVHARFAITIFEMAGAKYRQLEKQSPDK